MGGYISRAGSCKIFVYTKLPYLISKALCSIPGCKSTAGVKVARTDQQFEKWKIKLNNTRVKTRTNLRICEKHFSVDDYERDMRSELLGEPSRKKLRIEAVPTIGVSSSSILKNTGRLSPSSVETMQYLPGRQDTLSL